jgi:hypothetical protein
MVRYGLAICGKCKVKEAKTKHPWCNDCRREHAQFQARLKRLQATAQGYRSGWEAARARVVEMVQRGMSPEEISARL